MSNLNVYLPPFSPDYSGAASALYELGGMIVLHDASGCTGNVLGYDEPRWENAASSRALVFCSAYRHMEAVLGQDDKVIARIIDAAESLKPEFIAVVGSPVPMLVGTDYVGLAKEIEAECGIASFGFDTKGLDFYDSGYALATTALLRRYAERGLHRIPRRVNLLGLTPIDFGNNGNAEAIRDFIESNGWKVGCSFSMGFSIDDIRRAGEAELNIALSEGGAECAEFMKRCYGIPYIAGVPIGRGEAFLSLLRGDVPQPSSSHIAAKRALIIGEQVMSSSIRYELAARGMDSDAAIPFSHRKELLSVDDYPFVQEHDLASIMNSGKYSDVIGDPLFRQLLNRDDVRFHEMAHVGVSSKFHWNEVRNVLGSSMEDFIEGILQ